MSKLTTLIFIGHNQIVRCDVGARGKTRGLWSRPRPVGLELPGLVDAALRSSGRRLGQVYVLATDFWTQKVTLADEATQGLSREEVARSLAFEAESLSGLGALESEIGFCVIAAERRQRDYWIVQIPTWVRQQVDAVVRQAGARLRGLAHPGGLPQSVSSAPAKGRGWLRVEAWPGTVMAVGVGSDGRPQHLIAHADARSTSWRGGVDAVRGALGPIEQQEQLADAGLEPPLGNDVPALRLSEESTLSAWLPQWAGVLARGASFAPLLAPPKRPIAKGVRVAASVVLAVGVAAACAYDSWKLNGKIDAAQREITESKAKTAALETVKTRITSLEKEVGERQKLVEHVRKEWSVSTGLLLSYRTRWPRLLDALSRLCPEDATIRAMGEKGGKLVIVGTSLNAAAVDQLASALSVDLRGAWVVSPSAKKITPESEESEVCKFSLELQPATVTRMLPSSEPTGPRVEPTLTQAADIPPSEIQP